MVVHSSHDEGEAQASPGHSPLSHFQSVHEPLVGPAAVPDAHVPVDPHQPQPASTVHVPQVRLDAQGSAPRHSPTSHLQSPHEPLAGPARDPVTQPLVEEHQPQLGAVEQVSQGERGAQGSVVPEHASLYQTHTPHEPVDGPVPDPVWHALVVRHQPHDGRAVHESHPGESEQGSGAVDVHVPSTHPSPAQQSSELAHTPDPAWQAQRPDSHIIQPQQSALVRHVPFASTQHARSNGLSRQAKPVQHSPAAEQVAPAGPHDGVGLAQVPDRHSRPAWQRVPVAQQVWPSPPQVGSTQALPRHSPVHRVPQPPQYLGSVVVSTHARSQHVRPAPVQDVPPQHDWPSAPQVSGAVLHVPDEQTRPSSHALLSQHGWRGPPHGGGESHTPPVQTRPDAQVVPLQHGWRAPPQAAGGMHPLRSQTRPARQALPSQHGMRSPPHSGCRAQRPERHTRSSAHAMPEQHVWFSRPHAWTPVHDPDEHVSPGAHIDPLQHGCRS